jgi:hypothetical protein
MVRLYNPPLGLAGAEPSPADVSEVGADSWYHLIFLCPQDRGAPDMQSGQIISGRASKLLDGH